MPGQMCCWLLPSTQWMVLCGTGLRLQPEGLSVVPWPACLDVQLSGGLALPLLSQNLCCSLLPTFYFPVMLLLAVGRAPAACISLCPASGFTLW